MVLHKDILNKNTMPIIQTMLNRLETKNWTLHYCNMQHVRKQSMILLESNVATDFMRHYHRNQELLNYFKLNQCSSVFKLVDLYYFRTVLFERNARLNKSKFNLTIITIFDRVLVFSSVSNAYHD